jgi:hypothetical protein
MSKKSFLNNRKKSDLYQHVRGNRLVLDTDLNTKRQLECHILKLQRIKYKQFDHLQY